MFILICAYNITIININYYSNKCIMINIILFGKPGSGKGTQAEFLKKKYNLIHISTGDIFRNIDRNTELGKEVCSYTDDGGLVPDDLTLKVLFDEVGKHSNPNGILYDGFPRTIKQAESLDEYLLSIGSSVNATIQIEADDDILVERILERGKTSNRVDDQDEDKIRNRYIEYNVKTLPLIDYYRTQDKLYSIDGIGDIEIVTNRLSNVIEDLI